MSSSWQITLGILSIVVAGLGLLFLALQVRLQTKQAREAAEDQQAERVRLRKQSTLEFATSTFEVRSALRAQLPDDYDAAAITAMLTDVIAGTDARQPLILQYLAYAEIFAIAISARVHDVEMADSLFGNRLIAVATNYSPYIEHRRRTTEVRATFCRELEWLAAEIEDFRTAGGGYVDAGKYVPLAIRT